MFVVCLLWPSQSPMLVDDPVEFQASRSGYPIYKVEMDLDGDGGVEIYTSSPRRANGRAGLIWQPSIPVDGGYQLLTQGLSFHLKGFYLEDSVRLEGRVLVTYAPGGAGQLTFYATWLDAESQEFETRTLDRINTVTGGEQAEQIRRTYFDRFKKPGVVVQVIDR